MATIETILSELNANYTTINALIPTKYNFTDENNTSPFTSISDGGFDMYDTSNVFNTNLTNVWANVKTNGFSSRLNTSIPYTHTKHTNTTFSFNGNGVVTNSNSYFGSGSKYFTNLYPGMFVLVATGISITEFSITGNIGVDGGGTLTTDDFPLTVASNNYYIYRKSISGTTDPSINHIFIIPGTGSGVTHSWDTSRQYDDDVIQGLTGITTLYCLIVARASGALLAHSDAVNIATRFIEVAGQISSSSDQQITTTSISSIESISSAEIKRQIECTSIISSESVNSTEVKPKIEPNSISSLENINFAIFYQKIEDIFISSSETFGTTEIKLSTENITSIASLAIVNPVKIKLTIETNSINSLEFINAADIEFVSMIRANSANEGEQFGNTCIERRRFVFGYMLCPEDSSIYECKHQRTAMVPAVTVLNQKMYIRDKINRKRFGFYVEN